MTAFSPTSPLARKSVLSKGSELCLKLYLYYFIDKAPKDSIPMHSLWPSQLTALTFRKVLLSRAQFSPLMPALPHLSFRKEPYDLTYKRNLMNKIN